MPYCSRCGLEVTEDTKYCPRCGTEIRKPSPPREYRSTIGHVRYAFSVAKDKPFVFIPSIIGTTLSLLGEYILESWDVYRILSNELLDYMYAQSGALPISYAPGNFSFDWSLLISWVPFVLLIISLASWFSYLASYKASWMALNCENPGVFSSFGYVIGGLTRFMVGGFYTLVFLILVMFFYMFLMVVSVDIGLSLTALVVLLFSLALIAAFIMASPTFLIMVAEDIAFIPALKSSLKFTSRSLGPYLSLIILMWIFTILFSWIIPYGYYLSFIVTVLTDLSIMDLYIQNSVNSIL